MGNEASRATLEASPRQGHGGFSSPRGTPNDVRRSQSFTSSTSTSPASTPGSAGTPHMVNVGATHLHAHPYANPKLDKTIQRMDKAIRKRVRGGITYNMKLLIRGDHGTGKTSLFHRLKGEPIPTEHSPTPQIQSATINWNLRANSEESVRCEVWDVVDRGFNPEDEPAGASEDANGGDGATSNPFSLVTPQNSASLMASSAATTSMIGNGNVANGTHMVATVDASTVDVYHEAHGVIFLLDVTKWQSLEYVRQQLEKVPQHIPTLVLGNFRDCGNQRKIFKEDIEELLYGTSTRLAHVKAQLRRPHELLYFECSLLNCYGLKSLHQYFGIPFLQLKLNTLRQQMRILEGEFAHLKHDLQAKISEQRYNDYIDHIKNTGSDIRTGRRPQRQTSNADQHPQQAQSDLSRTSSNESMNGRTKLERGYSNTSTSSDVVVAEQPHSSAAAEADQNNCQQEPQLLQKQQDLEDLPQRSSSAVIQAAVPLKIAHAEENVTPSSPPPIEEAESLPSTIPVTQKTTEELPAAVEEKKSEKKVKSPRNEPMNLEDFLVPKQRNSDLDHFYSDEESDEENDDVVITPAVTASKSHKQKFLDSDSSSDEGSGRRRNQRPGFQRRHVVQAKQSATTTIAPSPPPSPPRRVDDNAADAAEKLGDEEKPPSTSPSSSSSPRKRVVVSRTEKQAKQANVVSQDEWAGVSPVTPEVQNAETAEAVVPPPATLTEKNLQPLQDTASANNDDEFKNIDDAVDIVEEKEVVSEVDDAPLPTESNSSGLEQPKADIPASNEEALPEEYSGDHSAQEFDRDTMTATPPVDTTDVVALESALEGSRSDSDKRSVASDDHAMDASDASPAKEDVGIEDIQDHSRNVEATPQELEPESVIETDVDIDGGRVDAAESADVPVSPQSPRGGKLSLSPFRKIDGQPKPLSPLFAKPNDGDKYSHSDDSLDALSPRRLSPVHVKHIGSQRKHTVLMSDDDDDDDDDDETNAAAPSMTKHAPRAPAPSAFSSGVKESTSQSTGSPSFVPVQSGLEDFLNDSDSGSEKEAPKRPASPKRPAAPARRHMIADSDDDDDDNDAAAERFAQYDRRPKARKVSRKQLKAQFQLGAPEKSSNEAASSVATVFDVTQSSSTTSSSVLEAIQKAQEAALRMMEQEIPAPSMTRSAGAVSDVTDADTPGGKKKKSKKKSSKDCSGDTTTKTKKKKKSRPDVFIGDDED
ncbi:TPA: hypothetical protein N0F65_007973 [Lagenidium giganteum]|uniref:GTP-binding protein Parf n=1 Tax=Lagenidium giganteum TaxID=4803 RepID=A0AAV2YJZ1_9STRA|nr:TPA: hypothetical protein N0F65_007973 [Lagenidium giganteum]